MSVTVRLPRELVDEVDAHAEAEGRSRTEIVETAIRERVKLRNVRKV